MLSLKGSPLQPYNERFYLTFSWMAGVHDTMSLVILVVTWAQAGRHPDILPTVRSFVLLQGSIILLGMLWRRLAPASYMRRHELRDCVLNLGTVLPAVYALHWRFIEEVGVQTCTGACNGVAAIGQSAALALFASAIQGALLCWLRPCRLVWSIPVQTAVSLVHVSKMGVTCRLPALTSEPARHFFHGTYHTMFMLNAVLLPVPPPVTPQTQLVECAVVLSYVQVVIALVAPGLMQMAMEARWFRKHQAERVREGLQPESGVQAWLYSLLARSLRFRRRELRVVLAVWLSACVVWPICAMLAPLATYTVA